MEDLDYNGCVRLIIGVIRQARRDAAIRPCKQEAEQRESCRQEAQGFLADIAVVDQVIIPRRQRGDSGRMRWLS